MFDEDFFDVKSNKRNHKNKGKKNNKDIRDRFGKQKKNKMLEEESLEHLNEFLDGEWEEFE